MKYYMQQQYYNNSAKVRVYASSTQGGRKYMEDEYSIVHHKCPLNQANSKNDGVMQRSFMFFGIFDGHGGDMAAKYSRDNLCRNIIRQREFWSSDDKKICLAIHRGFVRTQRNMLNEVGNWPKTTSGLPSTAGTTASIVFIMNGNYYTGHVGDSRIVLGRQDLNSNKWIACPMTRDHKPESPREKKRIEAAGGQVINKSGVGRVVWNRPKPYLNPTASPKSDPQSYDVIPFLAVARALGDLWSLNKSLDTFVVSPEPDVHCIPVDRSDRCLILASDGLWNMMNNQAAIKVVQDFEETHKPFCLPTIGDMQQSHASQLLDACMNRWSRSRYRADNTTVLTIMFDNDEDDDDEDLSELDSEVTESEEEEIDPEAQNRVPSTFGSHYFRPNSCPSIYSAFLNDLYGIDVDEDEEDLFNEKTNFNLIGETIHEMNLTLNADNDKDNYATEVSSVLSQLVDQVSIQFEGISIHSDESATSMPTISTHTTAALPQTSSPLAAASSLELFNELTDDQLSDIRFAQCSNWNPDHCLTQKNYNTVLTIDRVIMGFKDYLFEEKSLCNSSNNNSKLVATANGSHDPLPSQIMQMCKVVLHESQNTTTSPTTTTLSGSVLSGESPCDSHSELLAVSSQTGLDLIKSAPTTPPPVNLTVKCTESALSERTVLSNSSPIAPALQSLASLTPNSSPYYHHHLHKLNYKRKFDYVTDLPTPVSSSTGAHDFASSLTDLVGHHFHSKRFCALDNTESAEFLPNNFAVKSTILDCSKNQVQITASSND